MYGKWRNFIVYNLGLSNSVIYLLDCIEELIGPPQAHESGAKDLAISAWLNKARRLGLLRDGEYDRILGQIAQAI